MSVAYLAVVAPGQALASPADWKLASVRNLNLPFDHEAIIDFAREWIAENENGRPNFSKMQEATAKHPIEKIGAELRAMMPWISAGKAKPQDVSGG